jgi:Spy/CpxP family protein refolding chaperone
MIMQTKGSGLLIICLVWLFAGSALAHGPAESDAQYDYGFGWESDPVISHALGRAYLHGPGWDISVPGWFSMSREQSEKLQRLRDAFQENTLDLRKQLILKQMELSTLWAQPTIDSEKATKLSHDVATLQAEMIRKRAQHLITCRDQLGGEHWTCPGIWLRTGGVE